ncbi:hypothetical protein BVY01_00845, partial [bacterium I07]
MIRSRRTRMKNIKKTGQILAIIGISLSIITTAMADKSYQYTGVQFEAQLNSDGSMNVTESRTYRFKGRYRFAFRTFPLNGPVSFESFQLAEGGKSYSRSSTEEPGTFQVNRSSDEIEVKWFYNASNETRTFDISYRVQNAVKRHEDAAVLYYQFISDDFSRSSSGVLLKIHPPSAIKADDVREWLHGPLWATSRIEGDGTIYA